MKLFGNRCYSKSILETLSVNNTIIVVWRWLDLPRNFSGVSSSSQNISQKPPLPLALYFGNWIRQMTGTVPPLLLPSHWWLFLFPVPLFRKILFSQVFLRNISSSYSNWPSDLKLILKELILPITPDSSLCPGILQITVRTALNWLSSYSYFHETQLLILPPHPMLPTLRIQCPICNPIIKL